MVGMGLRLTCTAVKWGAEDIWVAQADNLTVHAEW